MSASVFDHCRYPKVIAYAVKHFMKYDLDALLVMTNAPGRSAFNRVERKMAPLSSQLAGWLVEVTLMREVRP